MFTFITVKKIISNVLDKSREIYEPNNVFVRSEEMYIQMYRRIRARK